MKQERPSRPGTRRSRIRSPWRISSAACAGSRRDKPDLDQTLSKTTNRRTNMRAMRAEEFSGYEGLKLVDLPKPTVSDGKVLLRMTAAGVTPLDHTILSGQFHHSKAPLVLG